MLAGHETQRAIVNNLKQIIDDEISTRRIVISNPVFNERNRHTSHVTVEITLRHTRNRILLGDVFIHIFKHRLFNLLLNTCRMSNVEYDTVEFKIVAYIIENIA